MAEPLAPEVLAAIARSGLALPKGPAPGQQWRPRSRDEEHLLIQARQLDRMRQLLLGEVGRLRHTVLGLRVALRRKAAPRCPLTDPQIQVLAAAAVGETVEATAHRLFMSESMVKAHRARAIKNLGAGDIAHAVGIAMSAHWITPARTTSTKGGDAS
jgi:DNA-binding CsgD family transcriptional regulator